LLLFPFQTLQAATDIKKYNIDQTGAKTQSGGVKNDLFKLEYQGSFELIVEMLPIKDAEYVKIAKMTNDINLFFSIIIYIYH